MKPSTRIGTATRALSHALACASFLVATGIAGGAHADVGADSERANLLFKKGKVAFNAGKYADALRIYTEAWSLKKSPDIAANLAQAESELGKHRDAAEHFAFALAHILPSSTDEQRLALADGLGVEKREIGSLQVTLEPADSALTIDDAPVNVPVAGDVYVEPGEHRVVVTHEGYEAHQETLTVSQGAARVLWIKLDQVAAAAAAAAPGSGLDATAPHDLAPPPLREGPNRSIVPVLVGSGLVVAGAVVGVGFLLSGNASQKDVDQWHAAHSEPNACGIGTPYEAACAALHSKNSDIDRARIFEVIGFSVAGAAAVGTAAYLLWPHSHAAASGHWSPTFAVAPGAGSIGLSGHF